MQKPNNQNQMFGGPSIVDRLFEEWLPALWALVFGRRQTQTETPILDDTTATNEQAPMEVAQPETYSNPFGNGTWLDRLIEGRKTRHPAQVAPAQTTEPKSTPTPKKGLKFQFVVDDRPVTEGELAQARARIGLRRPPTAPREEPSATEPTPANPPAPTEATFEPEEDNTDPERQVHEHIMNLGAPEAPILKAPPEMEGPASEAYAEGSMLDLIGPRQEPKKVAAAPPPAPKPATPAPPPPPPEPAAPDFEAAPTTPRAQRPTPPPEEPAPRRQTNPLPVVAPPPEPVARHPLADDPEIRALAVLAFPELATAAAPPPPAEAPAPAPKPAPERKEQQTAQLVALGSSEPTVQPPPPPEDEIEDEDDLPFEELEPTPNRLKSAVDIWLWVFLTCFTLKMIGKLVSVAVVTPAMMALATAGLWFLWNRFSPLGGPTVVKEVADRLAPHAKKAVDLVLGQNQWRPALVGMALLHGIAGGVFTTFIAMNTLHTLLQVDFVTNEITTVGYIFLGVLGATGAVITALTGGQLFWFGLFGTFLFLPFTDGTMSPLLNFGIIFIGGMALFVSNFFDNERRGFSEDAMIKW